MGVIAVAIIGTLLGFLAILLVGRGSVHPSAAPAAGPGGELRWVRGFGLQGFERLIGLLFAEMGFEVERSSSGDQAVDCYAVDPTPIKGGRVYVHGLFAPPLGVVDREAVRAMLETARAEFVGKGILLTLGGFSAEARAEARGTPVELVDGDALARLVRKHLPDVFAQRKL